MKKYIILLSSILLLSTLSFVGCNDSNKNNETSSSDSTSEQLSDSASNSSESEINNSDFKIVGEPSSNTHKVDYYYNIPGMGIYIRYYINDGDTLPFEISRVSGYSFLGFYADPYGINIYDDDFKVTEDINLYGHFIPISNEPSVEDIENIGTYTITWKSGCDSSFSLLDGGSLPTKANLNDVISFRLDYEMDSNKGAIVNCNGTKIDDNDGVYTITVTDNLIIESESVRNPDDINILPKSEYYLMSNINDWTALPKYQLVTNPSPTYSDEEYYIEDVELSAGDKVKICNTSSNSWYGWNEVENKTYENDDIDGNYVAQIDGKYSFYLKVSGGNYSIYVGEPKQEGTVNVEFTIASSDVSKFTGLNVFVWCWGAGFQEWIPGVYSNGKVSITAPKGISGAVIITTTKSTTSSTTWDDLSHKSKDITISGSTVTSGTVAWIK